MIKHPFKLALIWAFSVLALVACKKDKDNTPDDKNSNLLVGTWKVVSGATDNNNNGQRDADESQTIPPGMTITLTLNKDGTGSTYESDENDTEVFTWESRNNNQTLVLQYSPSEEYLIKIVTLTQTDLTLEVVDEDDNPRITWYDYKKQ